MIQPPAPTRFPWIPAALVLATAGGATFCAAALPPVWAGVVAGALALAAGGIGWWARRPGAAPAPLRVLDGANVTDALMVDSDARMRLLESAVVHAHDAVAILTANPGPSGLGRSVVYVNESFTRLTGYARKEVVGRSLHLLRGPDSDPETLGKLREALDTGAPLRVELRNYRKDGTPFWVDLSAVPVPDPDGRIDHWLIIQRDIDRRKSAERRARQTGQLLRAIIDAFPGPINAKDRDSRYLVMNQFQADLLGADPGHGRGPDGGRTDQRGVRRPDAGARPGGDDELPAGPVRGPVPSAQLRRAPVAGHQGTAVDARRGGQRTCRCSRRGNCGAGHLRPQGRPGRPAAQRGAVPATVHGHPAPGVRLRRQHPPHPVGERGLGPQVRLHAGRVPRDVDVRRVPAGRRAAGDRAGRRQHPARRPPGGPPKHRTRAGAELDVDVSSFALSLEGRTVKLALINDVTARRKAENELRRSEGLFRGIFESTSAGVSLTDASGLFVSCNPAFAAILGRSVGEVMRLTPASITHPDDLPGQLALMDEVRVGARDRFNYAKRYIRPDGQVVWVELSFAAIRTPAGEYEYGLGVSINVTERRQLEDQLRQAQKMEAVGQMAGGVAHDFNNLLTAVIGNLSLVRLPDGDPNRSLLAAVEQAANRAADLTGKLLGYARRNQLVFAPVEPQEAFDETVALLRRTLDPRIHLCVEVDADCPPVHADPTLLAQALMNLCLNARDAMPEGGSLTLSAGPVERVPEDPCPPGWDDLIPGHYVRFAVTDTGVGMTPDVLARIFEPFFTTKGIGKGTGLGLPMVQGIVKQHHGWIEIHSRPGTGTRIELNLPTRRGDRDAGGVRGARPRCR